MLEYIRKIQKQFIVKYGFPENPAKPGLPLNVPDGEYPIKIDGKVDRVVIRKGRISCGNFEEPKRRRKKRPEE